MPSTDSPSDGNRESGPTVTFGPSAVEAVLEPYDWVVDDDGVVIVEETGEPAPTYHGEPIHISDVGGVVTDPNGEQVLIRANFSDTSDFVKSV